LKNGQSGIKTFDHLNYCEINANPYDLHHIENHLLPKRIPSRDIFKLKAKACAWLRNHDIGQWY